MIRPRSGAGRCTPKDGCRAVVFALVTASGLLPGGCGEDSNLLAVEVQTDLVAGVEFRSVRSTLSSGQVELRAVTPADDFGIGRRVAEFTGIPVGAVQLRVELLSR